jgi:hypothetical protein
MATTGAKQTNDDVAANPASKTIAALDIRRIVPTSVNAVCRVNRVRASELFRPW